MNRALELRGSSPQSCRRYRWTRRAQSTHRAALVCSVRPPLRTKVDVDHHAALPPGVVVLSAALPPSGLRSGACLALPRGRRRHLFHHHRSDSAEALPIIHGSASLLRFGGHEPFEKPIDDSADGLRPGPAQLVGVSGHEADPFLIGPVSDVAGKAERLRRQRDMRDLQGFHPSFKRILHLPTPSFRDAAAIAAKLVRCVSRKLTAPVVSLRHDSRSIRWNGAYQTEVQR